MDNFQQDFINQLNEQAKPKEKRDLRLPIAAGIVVVLAIIIGIASLATTAKTEEEIATSNGAALKFFNYLITGKEEQKELPEYKTDANYYIETAIFYQRCQVLSGTCHAAKYRIYQYVKHEGRAGRFKIQHLGAV